MSSPPPPPPIGPGRAFLFYSLLRLLLLLISLAVLLAVGLDPVLAIGGAVLASALLSLVLLRKQREVFTAAAVARAERKREERSARRERLDDTDPQG